MTQVSKEHMQQKTSYYSPSLQLPLFCNLFYYSALSKNQVGTKNKYIWINKKHGHLEFLS